MCCSCLPSPPLQALLQQQLASGYSGLRGNTPQEQATLAALSALDPSMLQAHLTSGLGQHALSMQGSARLSMQGSAPQQHAGMPSTPSVGGGSGVGALLGMTPSSPAGPGMGRYSTTGVGFGAAGAGSLGGQGGAHRSSFTGGGSLELSAPGAGGYQQYRVSSGGSGLGGLGPIGPSAAGSSGHEGLFLDLQQQQAQQQQQQAGLMSPTWAGMAAARGGGGLSAGAGASAGAAGQWPQQFVCPLSNQVMSDPVVAADGVSYQREAITDWMRLRDVSPVTGHPLGSAVLQPNYALRAAIAAEVAQVQGSRGLV